MSEFTDGVATGMAANNNGCGGYGGGYGMGWGADWIWIIVLFALWQNGLGNGFGGNGGYGGVNSPAGQGALTRGDLCMDMNFSDLEGSVRGLQQSVSDGFHGIDNAVCQLGYQNAELINGVNMSVANGFHGVDNAICTLGYNMLQNQCKTDMDIAQAQNALSAQLASCCCDVREGISGVNYNNALNTNTLQNAIQMGTTQGIMNTNAIQQKIQECCCEDARNNLENRYIAQQNTSTTLQAIDRVGDRIIDYLCAEKTQSLRDENQALRLAASQTAQNNYLISQLGQKCAVPAYVVPNPNCCYGTPYGVLGNSNGIGFNGGFGCGCNG